MNNETPYLFVYGTLRTAVDVPAKQEVLQYLELVGEADIPGRMYDMGDYPAAIRDGHSVIRGEILKVSSPDKVFAILDKYEGPAYERTTVDVTLPDGTKTAAWIYWYTWPVEGKPLIRNKSYLDYLNNRDNVY